MCVVFWVSEADSVVGCCRQFQIWNTSDTSDDNIFHSASVDRTSKLWNDVSASLLIIHIYFEKKNQCCMSCFCTYFLSDHLDTSHHIESEYKIWIYIFVTNSDIGQPCFCLFTVSLLTTDSISSLDLPSPAEYQSPASHFFHFYTIYFFSIIPNITHLHFIFSFLSIFFLLYPHVSFRLCTSTAPFHIIYFPHLSSCGFIF